MPPGPSDLFAQAALTGNTIKNLRATDVSPDATEVVRSMDYHYDGASGPIAQIVPSVTSSAERQASARFHGSRVTVTRGQGAVSVKLKFLKSQEGVSAQLLTDQVIVQMLSHHALNANRIGAGQGRKRENLPKPSNRPGRA